MNFLNIVKLIYLLINFEKYLVKKYDVYIIRRYLFLIHEQITLHVVYQKRILNDSYERIKK